MASLVRNIKKKFSKKNREEDQRGKAANPPKVSTAASSKSANENGRMQEQRSESSLSEPKTDNENRPSTSTSGNDELAPARNEERIVNKGTSKEEKEEKLALETAFSDNVCKNKQSTTNSTNSVISTEAVLDLACKNDCLGNNVTASIPSSIVAPESSNVDLSKGEITNQNVTDLENQHPDILEGTREAEEHSLQVHVQVHVQEQALPKTEPLACITASEIMSKKTLVDTICLKLDLKSPVIQNWENLACELDTPQGILANCKRTTDKSPTELLFESLKCWNHTENLLVSKLLEILKELQRNDAVDVIVNHIPENRRENMVSDEITDNQEIMEELTIKLDKKSKVLKNWFHVGCKLGINKEILQEIGNGNIPNAVEGLFEYIYTKMPGLTVEEFKEKMEKIGRKDAKHLLDGYKTTDKMVEVAPLHSDLIYSIGYMLNKSSTVLKNWKHLASELKIDYMTYKSFESEPAASPTGVLLEWLIIAKTDFTVRDLCTKLQKMKRYDVIEILEKEFGQNCKELPSST